MAKKSKKKSSKKKKTTKKAEGKEKKEVKQPTPELKLAKKKLSQKKKIIKPRKLTPKTERQIAEEFAIKVHEKFAELVKATILFGSQAKKTQSPGSDIDIIILIDDAAIDWDMELISWYREELGKIIARNDSSIDLHINTIKLTTWWKDLMHGDPVVINILRYGEALIDLGGFFNPLKALLLQGKIHSTPEAVFESLQRAPLHLTRSRGAEMSAIEGVYWCMVDSAQAGLMTLGYLPPSPEHIPGMLKEAFVGKNMLHMDMIRWLHDIQVLHKNIVHGAVKDIKGSEIDDWQDKGKKFMVKMTSIVDKIIESRKK